MKLDSGETQNGEIWLDPEETGDMEPTVPSQPPPAAELTPSAVQGEALLRYVPLLTLPGQTPPRGSLVPFKTQHSPSPLPVSPQSGQRSAHLWEQIHTVTREGTGSTSWQERPSGPPTPSAPHRLVHRKHTPSQETEETNAALRAPKEAGDTRSVPIALDDQTHVGAPEGGQWAAADPSGWWLQFRPPPQPRWLYWAGP